jgi:hypothetical protein
MIRTVGDLLQSLKEEEEKRIVSFPTMSHGPSIGDMYEGTTRKLLDMAIFDGLDLKIREGFIKNSAGDISRQIDCMIVTGEGQKMPNTDHYLYDIPNVLAIVEVKKTLYGDELTDSLDWSRDFEKRISEPPSSQKIDLLRDAWRSITCQELPDRSEIGSAAGSGFGYLDFNRFYDLTLLLPLSTVPESAPEATTCRHFSIRFFATS